MNANLQTLSAPASSVEPLPPADPSQPRSKSKIAHLPKDKRDLINHLMDDGVTYEGIIARLAEHGITLNLKNVSDWFHGGYQDELLARERRAQLRLHQEHLLACAAEDINSLPLAGLQLAVTQLSQQIYELAPGAHKESFQNDTTHYLRMLNTLARMSKAMLSLQQYQDQTAQPESTQLQQIDAERDVNRNQLSLLANHMDRIFKIRRPRENVFPSTSSSLPSIGSAKEGASSSPAASNPIENQKSKIKNQKSLHPLINTPIHRGENAHRDAATVSTVSDPGTDPIIHQPQIGSNLNPCPSVPIRGSTSPIGNQKAKIENPKSPPECCHQCRAPLPPVLPSGERPATHCNKCGTPLRPPGALIEYCPKCHVVLAELKPDGTRPTTHCLQCNKPLPPPPAPSTLSITLSLPPPAQQLPPLATAA